MLALLRTVTAGLLQPTPARSYQQARVNCAALSCTGSHEYPGAFPPASKTTVDEPKPEHYRFML